MISKRKENPLKDLTKIFEYYGEEKYITKYFIGSIVGETNQQLTEREKEGKMIAKWVNIDELKNIFSTFHEYKDSDEMRCGLYLRELTALKKILNK